MGPHDHELRSIDTLRDDVSHSTPRQGLAKEGRLVQRRKRPIWILLFYLPFLIIPWALTCVMMFRPVNFPSYIDQRGSVTTPHLAALERWRAAVRVLNQIAAVLGIPIVSALLAHGAVVYTQRTGPGQHLNVLQMFSLADRKWLDVSTVLRALHAPRSARVKMTSTTYLWLAAGLILITALNPPLQSILIKDETKLIVTCQGHPLWDGKVDLKGHCDSDGIHGAIVGYDPEPVELANCPQEVVIQRTLEKIVNVGRHDTQMHLWPDTLFQPPTSYYRNGINRNSFASRYEDWSSGTYFASSITNGTSTGVYRAHAARMDSSVKCTKDAKFPATCKGEAPFETAFSHLQLDIDICVEGNLETTPWTTSRDKQEHSEVLWINVEGTVRWQYREDEIQNYTLKCESSSRRGWFELANYQNDYIAGPLLDVWPSQEELRRDFNNYVGWAAVEDHPEREVPNERTQTQWDLPPYPNAFSPRYLPTPGPLTTAAMAMFGNTSFFHAAASATEDTFNQTVQHICEQIRLPFGRFEFSSDIQMPPPALCTRMAPLEGDVLELEYLMGRFFGQFADVNITKQALEVAMFFANEALLTTTATAMNMDLAHGRAIYSSPGQTIVKPKKTIPGLIVISVLIFLQVLGLGVLIVFIYSAPTWTGQLDADALAQMGAQIGEMEPRPELGAVCGLVGVVEHGDEASSLRTAVSGVMLALGGEGVVSRRILNG